jgi:hypothetical protein
MPSNTGIGIEERLRKRFTKLADDLIPEADGMPGASRVDIGGEQLDAVIASRPDLVVDIRRALEAADEVQDPIAWLEVLRGEDPSGYEALVTAVVAGYYMHPDVKRLLAYPGQVPQAVSVGGFPDYISEGLLERVYERGPIYRPTPEG